jgi:brefeldin A-inhibited guanine nucleotide-exchange protein
LTIRVLDDLFDVVTQNGYQFSESVWLLILNEIFFPLLENIKIESSQRSNTEFLNLWMSTTMVGAFRLLIQLYSSFPILTRIAFEPLEQLMMACILQENDTLAKLGSVCISEYIEKNCQVFSSDNWESLIGKIVELFDKTLPKELFFEIQYPIGEICPVPSNIQLALAPTRKQYPKIVAKCVLHLNVIQTIDTILKCSNRDTIYKSLTQSQIFSLGDSLCESYIFAKMFNENLYLRQELLKMGFMKQLPNLLRQETSAMSSYITLLSKIFVDDSPLQSLVSKQVELMLLP